MEHLLLQLRRPPAQEQALTQLIDQLHNPASGKFHQWLTPSEFGAQFGPAASDIAQITGWLQRHGFRVNTIYPSGMTIDFSGTAGQVRTAFHTEIHHLQVNGVGHIANMSDPQIPAAFAPAVVGIVSLHDFMPRPTLVRKLTTEYTIANCSTSAPTTCYAVTPPDLATIYNFNPLFQAGTSGQNQTIYLIEDTDLYTTSDWTTFRSTFGLSAYTSGSLSTIHPAPPSGSNNCADPGVNSDDIEAILDAEYASAAAPSARIVLATCADTNTTFGALFAIQNLINGANPPAIISLSYIECEAANGASSNAAFSAIYQQGVAEGTSIFVAAGDEDAGSCDYNGTAVTHGIGVNALQRRRWRHRFQRHLFGDQQHLLESQQHLDLWFGQILRSGDSVERLLRRSVAGDFRTIHHHLWLVGLLQQQERGELFEQRGWQRWPKRLRDRVAFAFYPRGRQRQLCRIRQALLAERSGRHPQ
jgi:subtilase family serine protease